MSDYGDPHHVFSGRFSCRMISRMRIRIIGLAMLSLWTCSQALALPWSLPVNAGSGGGLWEYEIARDEDFGSSSLVDQGFGPGPELKGDLPPGLYYLRFRRSEGKGKIGAWSNAQELLLTSRKQTEFLEPLAGAKVESPSAKTAVLYRWKRIEGASHYILELQTESGGAAQRLRSTGPFATAELGYGKWNARVLSFAGKRTLDTSAPLTISLEPITQSGAQFESPQNDDIIAAYEKSYIDIRRSYTPEKARLGIQPLGGEPSARLREWQDISPRATRIAVGPLAPGTYQFTIVDELKLNSVVESNITVKVEEDPLKVRARGTQTEAEAYLGGLFGARYQTNHFLAPHTVYREKGGGDGPRIVAVARSGYFDPYYLELRGELLKTHFDVKEKFSNQYIEEDYEKFLAMSLLYRTGWPARPNNFYWRGGLFAKQYQQISETPGNSMFVNGLLSQSSVNLYGILTGADWQWQSWSRRWHARFSARLMIPLLSSAAQVATGSPSLNPGFEFSATLKRRVGEYWQIMLSPEIKTERWVNSEADTSLPKSEHYAVSYGVLLGLGLDL